MLRTLRHATLAVTLLSGLIPAGLAGQAHPFDRGRMWTFEAPPAAWFAGAYAIEADSSWFARARLGALRIPGCSASFVSPEGLVMTNHHCVRERVVEVTRPGEDLLRDGFVAGSREAERPIEGFVAEQLVWAEDVTPRILDRLDDSKGAERQERLDEEREEIEEELRERFAAGEDRERDEHDEAKTDSIAIEFVELWDGARTSVLVWRRFDDVRLVMVPEEEIGFFGGDADNFEYPRWNLDVAFLRVWDDDAPRTTTDTWFPVSVEGVEEGDPVFVVGNPGTTSRYATLAELDTRRDVIDPATLDFVTDRADILTEYIEAFPEEAREAGVSNHLFSALNSAKSIRGQLDGLKDDSIRGMLEARERALYQAVERDSAATVRLDRAIARIANLQGRKRSLERAHRALLGLTAEGFASPTLHRAFIGFQILNLRGQGAPVAYTADLIATLDSIKSVPPVLDELLLQARLDDFVEAFGREERWIVSLLRGRSTEGAATRIRAESIFADSAATAEAIQSGRVDPNDSGLRAVNLYLPTFRDFQNAWFGIADQEAAARREIAEVMLEKLDHSLTPDATGSLRIADGIVSSFTRADGSIPPVTTRLAGLFERARELGGGAGGADDSPWALPARWWEREHRIDPTVPLNFVASTDITGGNSGSAVINADLEVVGVAFDSPAESLPGDYLFLPMQHRAVIVDLRAVVHALEEVYDAGHLVREMREGAEAVRQPSYS
ncbi:MAG: S46 family peptidase [Longimicrobiales bacterium]|nr:S46 family peptidase [Longimicrobiales bacterium]